MTQDNYFFVSSLYGLKLSEPLGANWQIAGALKISSSKTLAKSLVNDLFRRQIGELEVTRLLDGYPFIYAVTEYPVEDVSEDRQLSVLYVHLVEVQLFVNTLWLIKDNAVNCELGFLQYPYARKLAGARVSSNFINTSFTDASGQNVEGRFSKEDLRETIRIYNLLYSGEPGSEPPPSQLGEVDRLYRALYFLQAARSTGHLPEKVSYYITCLEALVSTSSTELAHQVAERVAVLIGEDTSEAMDIYRNLKRAYDTRSKLVHGGQLTGSEGRYLADSTNCDNYLRRLLQVMLTNNDTREALEQDAPKVDEFFLSRLFVHVPKR